MRGGHMILKVTGQQNISKNCMVCGVSNQYGLKSRFYETEDQQVVALFTPREEHQSYPGIAHGGVSAALLDETIGRAIMTLHGDPNLFGVTVDLQVKYKKPVPLDVTLKVVGRITKDSGRLFEGTGELYLPDGTVAVTASGKYLKRNLEQITNDHFLDEEWFKPDDTSPETISLP